MSEHTPGPWLFGCNLSEITGANGVTHVADIYTAEEDAYLVKAAPELLEALEDALMMLYADEGDMAEIEDAIGKAEAAIRKAKGDT